MTLDPVAIGGWLVGVGAGVAAAFERRRAAKSSDKAVEATTRAGQAEARQEADKAILAQYDDLIRLTRQNANEWKEKAASEHAEFEVYRKSTHDKLNAANEKLLAQTKEIAELKARTDMEPVMVRLAAVLEAIDKLVERFDDHAKRA